MKREENCIKIRAFGGQKCNHYYIVMELGKISLVNLIKKYENNERTEKYNLTVRQIINDISHGVAELHSLGNTFMIFISFFKNIKSINIKIFVIIKISIS